MDWKQALERRGQKSEYGQDNGNRQENRVKYTSGKLCLWSGW